MLLAEILRGIPTPHLLILAAGVPALLWLLHRCERVQRLEDADRSEPRDGGE